MAELSNKSVIEELRSLWFGPEIEEVAKQLHLGEVEFVDAAIDRLFVLFENGSIYLSTGLGYFSLRAQKNRTILNARLVEYASFEHFGACRPEHSLDIALEVLKGAIKKWEAM